MPAKHDARLPLAFIPPGEEVRLAAFGEAIDPAQREQLTAYGLAANRPLRVLQQKPMTVILADEVELALEHAIARHVWVERIANENCSQSTEIKDFSTLNLPASSPRQR